MKTSLIIPFKNEIEYAETTISTVITYLSEREIDFEIIVVDDSSDGTWDIVQLFQSTHQNIIAIKGGEFGEPKGYGKALKKGFRFATGDIVIPFNGDLSDSLDDVISYIQLIESGFEMVFGSRFMKGSNVTNANVFKTLISWLGNTFFRILFYAKCSDITNSFKAYRKKVLEEINPSANGYNIGMEIALKGILKKYKYTTISITWSGRKYGNSKMSVIKAIPKYLSTGLKIRLFGCNTIC